MKEATGDMTMTVVVIIGVVLILTFARLTVWPAIKNRINTEINNVGYVEVVDDYNI